MRRESKLLFTKAVDSLVADWNTIPSGSMRPTILEGDVILVNRVAYDLKVPLIKRLVALPGDVVGKDNLQL